LFSVAEAAINNNGALSGGGCLWGDLLNIGGVLDIGKVSSLISMTDPGSGR